MMLLSLYQHHQQTARLYFILEEAQKLNARSAQEVIAIIQDNLAEHTGEVNTSPFAFGGLIVGIVLLSFILWYRNRLEAKRIQELTHSLEQMNREQSLRITFFREDKFSRLEDEIYKTVTYLLQTKEAAVHAKSHFAKNLENITHQLKTPITALSLTIESFKSDLHAKQEYSQWSQMGYWSQMEQQLQRLTRLEDALLLLSRLDAGTLVFQPATVDVYTLLTLAADNLWEFLHASHTSIEIPEFGEMAITVDLDWTMEAIMNIMKNCMEHHPGGVIHCMYAQNLLYTEISIWDEGDGFSKEDIPHVFERFYRGRNACGSGLGIGLALSKEIIEQQNGTLQAMNKPEGGACFEIRLYSH
jgi:signal transduction histidine kinase